MWGASEEPPEPTGDGPPDPIVHVRETCEQNKNQIENLKEIMLKNKQSLKRKEEEVQEYARRLSKIKSRAKFSRRSKDGASSSTESFSSLKADESISENIAEITDDIGQAKSSKAKSSLLQRKLAENRKVFEQRNKELTETKRVVVEKVEAIRQQLEEQLPVASVISSTSEVNPSLVSVGDAQEKEQKIAELNNKIMELEATIVDLQENLKEKDAVIDSKTKAVALVSADFSKRGKTTLDTLEDTKDEMRSMQENFILLETTLKNKNENLLEQLNERDNRIAVLEDTIKRNEELLQEQKIAETASVDFSRSTLDTLADTKDAMRSMQENFILIESSLKSKNDNLLKQLEERELKLAEANEKIYHLESGAGFIKPPAIEDLQYKLEKLEQNNKQLQEEKYILQKNIAELQDQILINKSDNKTDAIIEKDNRIAELENLIQELKQSNELLEEESKSELQKQVTELSLKNEEYINKINDLEKLVHNLEIEKNDIAARLPDDNSVSKENEKISQLTKELDDLNKTMIKIKAQHRSKLKNLQKQLDSFKKVSDVNAELVKLGNQVTLLEEEKASAGDWQERIADLESKVSAQEKELQMHITAIGALENQKLDLIQELHSIKREVSDLEAENAESENLRVTAEMKVVDLEEQLESLQKTQIENKSGQVDQLELAKKLELLTQENNELLGRLAKLEEKSTSDTGSTESFENIQEADKTELLKRIEDLTIKNTELTHKLSKIDERASSNAGSTESFETINDTDKNELLKKIDQLTHENSELVMKLSKTEEKGSSDTGSTESFERIPEHSESLNKIELLTQENNDLVIKLYKLEEKLERMECQQESLKMENSESSDNAAGLLADLEKHKAQLNELVEENLHLKQKVEQTIMENNDLVIRFTKLEEKYSLVDSERLEALEKLKLDEEDRVKELEERNDLSMRLSEADARIINLEKANKNLEESLESMQTEKKDIQEKLDYLQSDDYVNERLDLIGKLERLNEERESVAQERQELQEQMRVLLHKSTEELNESRKSDESFSQSSQVPENQSNISDLEEEIKNCKKLIAEQTSTLDEMRIHLSSKEEDLEEKTKLIASMQTDKETYISEISNLRHELKNTEETLTTWQLKCREMEEKLEALNVEKVAIEERLKQLEEENKTLIEESKAKDITAKTLKEEMESVVSSLEQRLQVEINLTSLKEQTIFELRGELESKDQELHEKYTQIQNEMIAIDGLQDELSNYKIQLHEKDMEISKLTEELQTRVEAADKEEKDKNEQLVAQIGSMTQKLHDLENQLTVKTEKISHLTADKNKVLEDLDKANAAFGMSENKYMNLQMDSFRMAEEHMEYNKELRNELADSYRMLEHLKMKHVEDTEMTNQRLNDVLEELNSKLLENEALKSELEEKRNFLEKYVPIDEKLQLETQVSDLEKNLAEARQKSQDQLEKMKKIAANLKKKTTICQELEARVLELEEKWMTEKDEKEAKNKKIQEVESSMKEKDNKITDLEEKLNLARNESAEVTATVEVLSLEATKSKEKLSVLMEQIAEMGDEIEELRNQMKQASADLSAEKQAKQNLLHEYESYKEKVERDKEQDQLVLDEVKENARELNVRMQVMEGEYVDQLAFIKNLQAENGLLVSKQAQINEKLENVEKESEDRRIFIEKIQKEVPVTIGTSTQTLAEDSVTAAADDDDESRAHIEQPFVQCEQCQTIIQALEAKLQERDAEIENLYNEMSNSIVNSFQLPETRRHSDTVDQSNSRNDDSYNELLLHYNALLSSNEELKIKLTEVINENVDLIEKKNQLEERIARIEQELIQGKKEIEAMQESSTAILEPLKVDEDLQRESQGIRQGSKNTREASTLDEPVLFNASEIFGTSQVLDIPDDKITELQNLLSEKETQCVSLTKEIADLKSSFHEEQVAHSELMARFNELEETSRAEIERLQQFLVERDRRIDDINAQLNNASLQFSDELESVAELNSLIQNRNKTIENLKTELANTEGYFKTLELTYRSDVESLEDQMSKLQATIQSSVEDAVAEFKQRAKEASDEKESLVLQVTDLLQTLEETRAAFASQQSLLVQERDQAKELADELKRSLSEYQKSLLEKEQSQIAPEIKEEPVETTVVETVECSKAIDESTEGTSQLGVDLAWDSGSAEKLNVDEEDWGWNAEEAQLASDHPVSLIPSIEVTLNARIEELQDQIKDLEAEKAKLAADSEAVQVRNGKLVKKLKEYKVQMESLQQQLKIQKSASDFGGLDFAIEEELKSQIENLEKTLVEVREGHKQVVAEKSALLKRLDSVSSANENFLEIKKKTDMEIHVLQIQNKELSDKVSTLEGKLREFEKSLPSPFQANTESPVLISSAPKLESETLVTSAPSEDLQSICKKYTDAIDDLKDELEALGTENEQLQQILEEQKTKLLSMESRVAVDANSLLETEELKAKNAELKTILEQTREDYDLLKEQYQQSLSDAETVKTEFTEKSSKYDFEINEVRRQIDEYTEKMEDLQMKLQEAIGGRFDLEEKVRNLETCNEKVLVLTSSLAEVSELLNTRVQEVAELKQELQKQYVIREESEMKGNEVIRALEGDLHAKAKEVNELKRILEERENELMQQKSSETINVIVSEATQELVQKHAIELEDKSVQICALSDQLAAVQHTAEQYSLALQDKSTVIDNLQEEVMRLKQTLEQSNLFSNEIMENLRRVSWPESKTAETDILTGDRYTIEDVRGKLLHLLQLEDEVKTLKGMLSEANSKLQKSNEELDQRWTQMEHERHDFESMKQESQKQIEALSKDLKDKSTEISQLKLELDAAVSKTEEKVCQDSGKVVDGLPVFTMGGSGDYDQDLQLVVDKLKAEMAEKQEEVNHLRYLLDENTYPRILQEMQDNINCLQNERRELVDMIETTKLQLNEKHEELERFKQQSTERDEKSSGPRERRSLEDQEQIVKLQNELHELEQEINELKYIIREKDSQLAVQAMEPQTDDYELRNSIDSLTSELYSKEQEIQQLRTTIAELQNEVSRLQHFEHLSYNSQSVIEQLSSEKEQVRLEAERYLEQALKEKELEIQQLQQRLYTEKQEMLESLQLRNNDVQNLKIQIEQSSLDWADRLRYKEDELHRVSDDLAEKERRLAELSITKDAELHNLRVQIHEKDVRIEELLMLTEEEEKQLAELRQVVDSKEAEINVLKGQLEEKIKEYDLIQHALKKDISIIEAQVAQSSAKMLSTESGEMTSNELDLALYMLHQRDVRCEELTHELMQLLEERDTLQLRLSNAIRMNEELRKTPFTSTSPKKEAVSTSEESPIIEEPSPSKSEGPVEIAREAIDISLGEDKEALAEKLSQLHTVGHARDVRLRDERELRHTQQMSLLAHKDVLSTLPPEAAARLVNANYTLSRDVQSQSSVLMNWLWGKSTPKVVHM